MELLTIRDVARHFKVDDTTVRRWIKAGLLAAVKLPLKTGQKRIIYRIRAEEVERISRTGKASV